jgi:hypothetical protein
MAKPQELLTVPITLALKPEVLERIQSESRSGDVTKTLAVWAGHFITQYADGGIMLERRHLDHLKELNEGAAITEAPQVVKMVEAFLNREEGQFTVKVQVDPALQPALEQHAREMGWTVQDILTETVNQVMQNSWVFEFPAEDSILPLGRQDHDYFSALTGKGSFTARELRETIEARLKPAEATA